ncbi:uncharacterized protein FA14DRAFT_192640 [Meira miltonrushii]|uniref:N-acetyltransferase domain-containing protein n=1 Tax=Meira miltonrushii TaxID=1280837 RepID=A0A316V255_9BASI|nr:uncharacterized protein FA14DRAFT_192640 [Meira miltonrushii]PWN31542.1 hypothetical protein FA14DRAFT_192640 [Meira miltonrushii]
MPTIKVRSAGIDDVNECAQIVVEAYSTLESNDLMFPNESKSRNKLIQGRIDQFTPHLLQEPSDPHHVTQYRVACFEEESGAERTAALLRWSISTVEDSVSNDSDTIVDAAVADKLALLGPEYVNVDIFRAFRLAREQKHIQWFQGKGQHIFIHTLAVSPNCQRMGCGAALMKCMTKEADELGLMCYLEASDEGKPLYLKNGFEEVEKMFVQSPTDGQSFTLTLMIRPAKKQ